MAIYLNLFVDQGSDYSKSLQCIRGDRTIINLTDYEAIGLFKKHYESSETFEFQCTILDVEEGLISVNISNELSSAINAGRYVYEIKLRHSDTNEILRVFQGLLIFNQEIKIPVIEEEPPVEE